MISSASTIWPQAKTIHVFVALCDNAQQGIAPVPEANLLAFVGHNGLMDFSVKPDYEKTVKKTNEVIMLACYSQHYFAPEIKQAGAKPILWTTNFMAPKAYTIKATNDAWMKNKPGSEMVEKSAQAYYNYQKCGIVGAGKLFTSGF